MRKWSAVFDGCPISDFAVGTMPACSDCFNYWGALSEKESLAKELAQSKAVEVCIYNKLCFHSWKRTIIYMVFGFYFTAVLALVGFPNIASLKIDFAVNVIPFLDMVSDFVNACLNILLFVPFGFFLPILWDKFRNIKNIALMGFIVTSLIEISQIFTFRTSDINDIITNTVGTIIGYFIVYRITDNFTKRIFSNSKMSDFYIICVSVALIMFFLQPFISSLLWEIVL